LKLDFTMNLQQKENQTNTTFEKEKEKNHDFKLQVNVLNDDEWKQCFRCRRYQLKVNGQSRLCPDCDYFVANFANKQK